ncbi:MAG: C4-type zinc ribbon domain-containing protein [Bacteroidetes bacterium]|nr:C4-type zinc ribbon domain-containing protein [Bacteroidota bacterium]
MTPSKSKTKEPQPIEIPQDQTASAEENNQAVESNQVKEPSTEEKPEISIEKKLIALYQLQQIDTQIDKIRIIRGELPLEVQDLEDEIIGLTHRVENFQEEVALQEKQIREKEIQVKESESLISKYKEQQNNVRNNREYDYLSKEIEFQDLEKQLAEKRIKEFKSTLDSKKDAITAAQEVLAEKQADVDVKKAELKDIVEETEKEEQSLVRKSDDNQRFIEDRLLTAYKRIRKNARNGLAVVMVERGACGGCFNKIPPQHQLEISMHKKIIVCEYCGRILVDEGIVKVVNA